MLETVTTWTSTLRGRPLHGWPWDSLAPITWYESHYRALYAYPLLLLLPSLPLSSPLPSQFNADVVGCNVNPTTGMVDVLDTWNPGSVRANDADMVSDVGAFTTSFENNTRIKCS